LHGLFVNQSALQRVRPLRSSKPFHRDNLIPSPIRDSGSKHDRVGLPLTWIVQATALPKPAAELRSFKAEIIAQKLQGRGGSVNRRPGTTLPFSRKFIPVTASPVYRRISAAQIEL
jgi:hypothetical protein